MSHILDITDLTVEYVSDERSVRGADRVSLSIAPGEILGLAGESGCGKSTIANAVMRLLRPPARISTGSIIFDGQDVMAMDPKRLRQWRWREVAMVFQSAMNSLNPLMRIGISWLTSTPPMSASRNGRPVSELLNYWNGLTSRPIVYAPTRTSSLAGSANE